MKFLNWIATRAKEPSTVASIAVLATIFGLPPGTIEVGAQVVGCAAAVAGVILSEKK